MHKTPESGVTFNGAKLHTDSFTVITNYLIAKILYISYEEIPFSFYMLS